MSPEELVVLISTLQVETQALEARIAEKQAELASQRELNVNLKHEIELLRRRLYGNKTERQSTSELQLTLGDLFDAQKALQKHLEEQLQAAKNEEPQQGQQEPSTPPDPKPKAKPKGRRDLSVSQLPRVVLELVDEQLEKTAKRIGFEESLQLMHRPGGFAVLVKRTAKYEVPSSSGPSVLGVPTPKSLFPRGLLHTSAIAHILVQKFALGVPLYRLEQHMSQDCPLDRGTMCRYVEEAGGSFASTIVHAMWQDALSNASVISTDATGALVQPEPGTPGLHQACKRGHFFTAVVDCDSVLFDYTQKHNQTYVRERFGSFRGYLQGDASNVYDILDTGPPGLFDEDEGVILVACWAHCRRYFFEAAITRHLVGVQGLVRIRAMFAIDAQFQKLPPRKRSKMREEHLRPVMEGFFEWVAKERAQSQGRNLATKALGYALNQQQELLAVLRDGRLPLDNTRAERALRKIVVGRKNWMFYGSDTHAESAAAHFSLIATCRLHRIEPTQYLNEIMRLIPYWPKDRYIELAPHKWVATRAKLDSAELDRPLSSFTIPPA